MKERLISKLETFTILRVIAAIILTVLVLYLLSKALGIHSLAPLQASLNTSKDILFSLIEVVLALIFLIFLLALAYWIKLDEGILIRPFEIDASEGKYKSQSISNMLITDLQKIR
jgi:hypothetical protein